MVPQIVVLDGYLLFFVCGLFIFMWEGLFSIIGYELGTGHTE